MNTKLQAGGHEIEKKDLAFAKQRDGLKNSRSRAKATCLLTLVADHVKPEWATGLMLYFN